MKITKRKITAASAVSRIPALFDKYYRVASDSEVDDYTGYYPEPGEKSPCEEARGYNIKHIAWAMAKDEYLDALADDGIDIVELVVSDWDNSNPMLAYVVGDRVYPLDIDEVLDCVQSIEDEYDNVNLSQDIKCYGQIDETGHEEIVSWLEDHKQAAEDAKGYFGTDDLMEVSAEDIESWICDHDQLAEDYCDYFGLSIDDIRGCSSIKGAVDTGLEYWYYTRHGMGPGTIPKGVQILDWYEEGYKTWIKLDKMLTTSELNEYEIKEQTPPEGVVTHNGDIIEGCSSVKASTVCADDEVEDDSVDSASSINASECKKVAEDENSIDYVVSSEDIEAKEDFVVDYDLSNISDAKWKEMERQRIAREMADEADAWDLEHREGEYEEVEGETAIESRSLINYGNYRIMSNPEAGGWDVLEKDYSLVKGGFSTEPAAKRYIDDISSSTNICSSDTSIEAKTNEDVIESERDKSLEPEAVPDVEEFDDIIIDFPFEAEIEIKGDGTWDFTSDFKGLAEDYANDDVSADAIVDAMDSLMSWDLPYDKGNYSISGKAHLVFSKAIHHSEIEVKPVYPESNISEFNYVIQSKISDSESVEGSEAIEAAKLGPIEKKEYIPNVTEAELDDAILNNKPFDIADFKYYKSAPVGEDVLRADQLEVGDVIEVTESAEEVNLGTCVKILSINDPGEDWIDYTFHVELLEMPGRKTLDDVVLNAGDEMDLHFDKDEYVGKLVIE